MQTRDYIFTGFMPSGNPFLWFYDDTKNTAFTTSVEVRTWSEEPKINDKIRMIHSNSPSYELQQVFINDKLVYERTEEKVKEVATMYNAITSEIKAQKGFV